MFQFVCGGYLNNELQVVDFLCLMILRFRVRSVFNGKIRNVQFVDAHLC